jgi:uncharacterized protein YdeI (YjbR/CyaY-like superfamily)
VAKLIKINQMAEPGMAKIRAAKKNGMWDKPDRPEIPEEIPQELIEALNKNSKAKNNFEAMAPSHKKHYIAWIAFAKKPETRSKRLIEAVRLLEKNEKLGLR